QRGGSVVRMPLEAGGQLQQCVVVERLRFTDQSEGGQQAGHHGTGAGAQAAPVRNGVLTPQVEPGLGSAAVVERGAQRPHDQVLLALGYLPGAGTGDLHAGRPGGGSHLQVVVDAMGQAESVESRAQVGAGGRHPHTGLITDQAYDQARPRARTASAVRAGITSGSTRASPSAVAVSFRPCPVTVHTTVAPAGTSPASARTSSPATLAAEAGSTNTPTRRATRAWASRIWASLTASMRPEGSSRAATARDHEAGLPMRMAVATVSGFSSGSPLTSGEAPSACTPHMAGVRVAGPSAAYSR